MAPTILRMTQFA